MRNTYISFAALLLAACTPRPTQPLHVEPQVVPTQIERFRIERVGVFNDSIAYLGVRGVYVITDTRTGREFVGVSGIGISENGSHLVGKVTIGDER